MKKMSKRFLSMFLAAVMVFTTVPFAAITALADPAPAVTELLTTGIDSQLTNTDGVTWDSTENAAVFNGGYLTLNYNPLDRASSENGFAFSFDFKTDSSNGDNGRIIDISDGGANSFAVNGGSTSSNEWRRGLTITKADGVQGWYYSNDFANTSYCEAGGTLWKPEAGTWYNLTVILDHNGQLNYYVNGTLYGKFLTSYYDYANGEAGGHGKNGTDIANAVSDCTFVYIGRSIYNTDGTYKGKIRNLKFFNGIDAQNAMTAYESLLLNGDVHTNIGAGYTAYVNANKAWDAYYYGDNTSADIYGKGQALTLAMANMKVWHEQRPSNSYTRVFKNDSVDNAAAYHNLLWAESGYNNTSRGSVTHGDSNPKLAKDIYYPDATMFYRDVNSKPTLAILIYFRSSGGGNKNRWALTAFNAASKMVLVNGKWGGNVGDNNDATWGISQASSGTKLNCTNSGSVNYSNSDAFQYRKKGTLGATSYDGRFANYIQYTGTMDDNTAYDTITPSITIYASGDSAAWKDSDSLNGTVTGGIAIHVINYARLVNKIAEVKGVLNNSDNSVANYREGGAAAYLNAVDGLTSYDVNSYFTSSNGWNDCQSQMTSRINTYNSATATADDGKYQALRDVLNGSNSSRTFADTGETVTVKQAYNNGVNHGYTKETYGNNNTEQFWGAYETARNQMANLETTGYNDSTAAQSNATALRKKFDALAHVSYAKPTLTDSAYLGAGQDVTITNNESGSQIYYTVAYDGESTPSVSAGPLAVDANGTYTVFADETTHTTAVVTAHVELDGISSQAESKTYSVYKAPSIGGLTTGTKVIAADDEVTVLTRNSSAGTLYYKVDGMADFAVYTPGTTHINPLSDGSFSKVVYAKEISGNAVSAITSVTFTRKNTFVASVTPVHEKGDKYYTNESSLVIADSATATPSARIMYKLEGANGATVGETEYTGAVPTSTAIFTDNVLVRVKMYYEGHEADAVYGVVYNAATYESLIYRESFDDTTASGTTLTKNAENSKTLSGTSTGTISIVEGAGEVISGGDYDGRSPDWRNNVLKLSATANPGANLVLDSNPFAASTAAAASNAQGVTISFWRHMEDTSGNVQNTGDMSLAGITFYNKDDNAHKYFTILPCGVASRSDGAINNDNNYNDYIDFKPDPQDPTQHAAGNYNGRWVHIAVTIDPTSGVIIYTNGEPHPTTIGMAESNDKFRTLGGNSAATAQEILAFITDSDTKLAYANGVAYWGNAETNLFLDDIRFYTEVKTQVDINNMYTDKYADYKNTMSTSHDPTNVTVYTLGSDLGTYSGSKVKKGTKVGKEFIEKYGVDPSTCSVEYYSFGTGMTIYHSNDSVNWTIVGDSQGRCGYQNEDLFGAEYHSALADALAYAATDSVSWHVGKGHLVWAPHVMYNLNREEWVYYGSTSSWGSQTSAIFMCTSDEPAKNYEYQRMVYKSNTHPNAIDSCVYYNADYTKLYMLYGSWGGTNCIYVKEMNLDGTQKDNTAGSRLCNGVDNTLEGGLEGSSGEGAYVVYDNGYYYLYVSYGQNTGTYTERVFRSTKPDEGFEGINEVEALDTTTDETHGNQLLAPFDIKLYDHTYVSTGHNSVYKVKSEGPDAKMGTEDDEWVTLNSVHARPYAAENHRWMALQDGALATRQSEVTGNVNLVNLIGYTEDGWPVLFPNQYDGTDSLKRKITAYDLEGIYTADDMRLQVNSNFGLEYTFTMLAKSETTGIAYGVKPVGDGTTVDFLSRFVITHENGYNYITMYCSTDSNDPEYNNIRYKGVIASQKHGKTVVPMLGLINEYDGTQAFHQQFFGEHAWAYRSADIPDVDHVISEGDYVSSDNIIYTHASQDQVYALATITRGANESDAAFYARQKAAVENPDSRASQIASLTQDQKDAALGSGYAVYGQEISDNYSFGTNASNGERYTTIDIRYPMYIDTAVVGGNVISLNDTEYCRDYGETGSNINAVERFPGKWCTKDSGGNYTIVANSDSEAATYVANNPSTPIYKVYYLKGKVSTFFRYYNNENDGSGEHRNGYPKVGVTLVVNYKSKTDENANWSEFEFMYVMPNPAWAHTMAATRNTSDDKIIFGLIETNNRQSSIGNFNRFLESYGDVTPYWPIMLQKAANGTTQENGYGTGVSAYITDFDTKAPSKDLTDLSKINAIYKDFGKSIGVNAGSYSAQEHEDSGPNAYVATPDLVNVNYYVDYSDKGQYLKYNPRGLIRTSNNNTSDRPVGYQFLMKTSNFLWKTYEKASIMDVTSYARNTTGLEVTYESTPYSTGMTNIVDGYVNDSSGWDDDSDDSKPERIARTNDPLFRTWVTSGGERTWSDDEMLFHTDLRNSSNANFTYNYRNRYLYWFTKKGATGLATHTENNAFDDGYMNGTKTAPQYYNYLGMTAYTTYDNGKKATSAWKGTATFKGKTRVTQNTVNGPVYDGYWYKKDGKQEWTSEEGVASSASEYGDLDVTAETLANYILELGTYHKVYDMGADGGRMVGNETYHYYNIGVATCDKGAARDFMDTFALKELKYTTDENGIKHVTLDENGRPEVDDEHIHSDGSESGDLWVQDVSAASYRNYLYALARLEWFVKNPQNTLQNDLLEESQYAPVHDLMDNSNEYVTAYDATSGKAVYVVDKQARNVFNDGTSYTDKVQAKLIADVIEAYEHLYTVDDYREIEEEYKKIKKELDDALDEASGDYTQESIDDYEKAFKAIEKAVAYYTDENIADKDNVDYDLVDFSDIYDEDYWRYSDYSGTDYDTIRVAMKEIEKSLMPKVDESVLQATANAKAGIVAEGIYSGSTQVKRYDQWKALYSRVKADDGTKFVPSGGTATNGMIQQKAGLARYATYETKSLNEVLKVDIVDDDPSTSDIDEHEASNLTYKVYRTALPEGATAQVSPTTYVDTTGDVYVKLNNDTDGYAKISVDQKAVNDENYALDAMTVDDVDEADAYTAYNSAYNVISNSVNREKYTTEGRELLDLALSTRYSDIVENEQVLVHHVYDKATQADVDLYTQVMGSAPFANDDELKVTGLQQTDPITAAILSAANELEAEDNGTYPYIRQFTVNYDVTGGSQTYERQSKTVYYGDKVEFDIPEEAQNKSTFSFQYYNDDGTPVSAEKIKATFNGDKLQRVAKCNMDITVTVSNKAQAEGYKVQIKNIYGTVIDVFYCATLPEPDGTNPLNINGESYPAPVVPFYNFTGWTKSVNETDRTATYTANYNAGESLTFDFEGIENANVTGAAATAEGATTYTTAFDTQVTIDGSEVANFYAWATEIKVGGVTKYQIASYSPKYSFYAVTGNGTIDGVTGEKFIPVLRTGTEGNYTYTVNNQELTAAKVDSNYYIDADPSILNSDAILKQKLDSKAPFISTISAKMSSDNKAATGYCRVAYDVNALPSEIGVLARSKATTAEQMESVMALGTAAKFKTANVLETGQFIYTITKTSVFANPVLFRGYIYYDFTYKFGGTNTSGNQTEANLNIGETSGYIATTATA